MGELSRKTIACSPPGVIQHSHSLNFCSTEKETFSKVTWRVSDHTPPSIYVKRESERKDKIKIHL